MKRKPRDRVFDHFYAEETDPQRVARNDRPQLNRYIAQTQVEDFGNPLAHLEKTNLGLDSKWDTLLVEDRDYFLYVPEPTRAAAAKARAAGGKLQLRLTLLFCVNDQMNRAGLRTFFAQRTDAALITIPGVEDTDHGGIPKPWGIGIKQIHIEQLLQKAAVDVDYKIEVLAAYSTGYHGLQGTILADFVPLADVERIIYYDCLVAGDQYKPGAQTKDAIAHFRNKNSKARIIVYEVTDGTKRYGGNLAISDPNLVLINLKPVNNKPPRAMYLKALQFARMLDEGAKDGFFDRSAIPSTISDLITQLRPRGDLASDQVALGPPGPSTVVPSTGKPLLEDWGKNALAFVTAVGKSDYDTASTLIFENSLMGWHPPFASQIEDRARHDQFMPEFAWEFLPP